MTKRSLVALFVAAVSCAASAQEYAHEQFAYQEPLYVPRWSTPYLPQDTMPEACRNPDVEAYIRDWEAVASTFARSGRTIRSRRTSSSARASTTRETSSR